MVSNQSRNVPFCSHLVLLVVLRVVGLEGTQPCAAAERAELEAQSLPTMATAPFNESSYLVAEVRFHLGLVQGPNRF